ncbi:MAG: hypothetical protein GY820_21260 [Gammaproteobacteria bacterium]|nr:hypothetical protein [Gammaproteobacteria bacterium]
MSEGLMCLNCRMWISDYGDPDWLCHCDVPIPSTDGKSPRDGDEPSAQPTIDII